MEGDLLDRACQTGGSVLARAAPDFPRRQTARGQGDDVEAQFNRRVSKKVRFVMIDNKTSCLSPMSSFSC
jgi:hypothetical protein